jgi:hypothetical protein
MLYIITDKIEPWQIFITQQYLPIPHQRHISTETGPSANNIVKAMRLIFGSRI